MDIDHPQRRSILVFLDGQECRHVTAADEEGGTVTRMVTRDGRLCTEPCEDCGRKVARETVSGRVEVRLRGGGRPVPLLVVSNPRDADNQPARDEGYNRPAACVIGYRGDVVMLSRRTGTSFGGMWQVVGGGIERQGAVMETPREAAQRELLEEAGVRADLRDLVYLARESHAGSNGMPFWLYFFSYNMGSREYSHTEPSLMSPWQKVPMAVVPWINVMWGLRGPTARAFMGEYMLPDLLADLA